MDCRTSTDLCRRSTESSRSEPAQASVPAITIKLIRMSDIDFFMNWSFIG